MSTPLPQRIRSLSEQLDARLVQIRRQLHQHPELSNEEFWTTERLRTWLTGAGIPILPLPLKTGLVAELRGAQPGPVIALRADIDALPVTEETGLPYASQIPGKMHACGHDFHTATILGAALILREVMAELPGTVRILFQPSEELSGGALALINAGALEGVSAIFGAHNKPDVPSGHVGVKAGPLMAAVDRLQITVTGKGGHAAIPNATADPIVAASAIVTALQTIVSRVVSPLDAAVVSIGSFHAGTAGNVIPTTAGLRGTLRTFRREVRDTALAHMERIIRQIAVGYGCTAKLDVSGSKPPVENDAALAALVRQATEKIGMPLVEAVPTMGAEDFCHYQQRIPGCFIWLGTGCQEDWHHPKFLVDEHVIHQGAALFAQVAVEALTR